MKVTIEIEDRQIDGALLCLEAIRQCLKLYGKGREENNPYASYRADTPHGHWEYEVEK